MGFAIFEQTGIEVSRMQTGIRVIGSEGGRRHSPHLILSSTFQKIQFRL